MADFDTCFEWMMDNEDRRRQYAIVPDYPPGSHAISGINSHSYPDEFQIIAGIPQAERGSWVKNFYEIHFWSSWYGQIISNDVAKRVFDMAVNGGPGTAVKLIQAAVNSIKGAQIVVDGHWGPHTLEAINNQNSAMLVNAFQSQREDHYRAIVAANPAEAGFLDNWLARAAA
jgi:hypothetical protein